MMAVALHIIEEHRQAVRHNPHRAPVGRRAWWQRIRQGPREPKTLPRRRQP